MRFIKLLLKMTSAPAWQHRFRWRGQTSDSATDRSSTILLQPILLQPILEFEFQNLTIGVAGQCSYKDDLPWQFDLIDSGTKELDEFEVAGARARFQRNEGDWNLAPLLVGRPHDRNLGNGRMIE